MLLSLLSEASESFWADVLFYGILFFFYGIPLFFTGWAVVCWVKFIKTPKEQELLARRKRFAVEITVLAAAFVAICITLTTLFFIGIANM